MHKGRGGDWEAILSSGLLDRQRSKVDTHAVQTENTVGAPSHYKSARRRKILFFCLPNAIYALMSTSLSLSLTLAFYYLHVLVSRLALASCMMHPLFVRRRRCMRGR